MIGEGSVGVSSEWSCEVMVDGHFWVKFGVVGYSEEEVEVGHLVEVVEVGHFVEVVEVGHLVENEMREGLRCQVQVWQG